VLGNAFVGRESLAWFQGLRRPAMQLPMPGFYAAGVVYYLLMGVVIHRAGVREDARAYRRAIAVLASNELWNAAFFGRRSTRAGVLGIIAFTAPLGLLHASVAGDRVSTIALGSYTAWVVGYDIPWAYQLWRLNPGPASPARAITAASRPASLTMRTVSSTSPPAVVRTITDRRRCRSMPTNCCPAYPSTRGLLRRET